MGVSGYGVGLQRRSQVVLAAAAGSAGSGSSSEAPVQEEAMVLASLASARSSMQAEFAEVLSASASPALGSSQCPRCGSVLMASGCISPECLGGAVKRVRLRQQTSPQGTVYAIEGGPATLLRRAVVAVRRGRVRAGKRKQMLATLVGKASEKRCFRRREKIPQKQREDPSALGSYRAGP